MRFVAAGCCLLALIACQRERRDLRPAPAGAAVFGDAARLSQLQPGGAQSQPLVANPYQGNAYAISEGQRLFAWYNCSGCHANGGGGIGPPLIKHAFALRRRARQSVRHDRQRAGPMACRHGAGASRNIRSGRLVAFVRSLNGLEPKSATPVRDGHH